MLSISDYEKLWKVNNSL